MLIQANDVAELIVKSPTAERVSLDWKTISLASIGGGLEFYDFIAYGIFAPYIAKAFFPASDPATSLVAAFAAFAVGYVSRPLGGLVFSHIGDRLGRRKSFMVSLVLMTAATFAMALMPSNATIGVTATILFVLMRFIQGCCLGGELPGAIAYVVETAPKRAGLACGVMFFCVNTGIFVATSLSSLLHALLTADQMAAYGWRIGFLVGAVLGVLGYLLRTNLRESAFFKAIGEAHVARVPALEVLRSHLSPVLIAICIISINQALIAMLNVSMVPFLIQAAGYDAKVATLAVNIAVGVLSVGIVVVGFASDFLSRPAIYVVGTLLVALASYPLYLAILSHSFDIIVLFLAVATVIALVSGTFSTISAELFPTRLRFTGLAISYNIAAALIGGFTPLVSAWLVARSGDKASPAIFLAFLAVVGLIAALAVRRLTSRAAAMDTTLAQTGITHV